MSLSHLYGFLEFIAKPLDVGLTFHRNVDEATSQNALWENTPWRFKEPLTNHSRKLPVMKYLPTILIYNPQM
jgi:hypothetical protein